MGFYSNLPITYKDDIVLFVCATYNKNRYSNATVYATDEMMPIFMPLKGKYDDYGGIELYDKEISNTIEEIINVKLDDFLKSIDCGCAYMSLNDLKEYDKDDDNIKIYKKGLTNIVNSMNSKIYSMEDISICYTMERLDVYEKISSIFNWCIDENEINKIIQIREKYNIPGFITNENDSAISILDAVDEDKEKFLEKLKYYNNYQKDLMDITNLVLKLRIGNCEFLCYGYHNVRMDEKKLKDKIIEFLKFNFGLHYLNGIYRTSPTSSQDIKERINEAKILNNFYQDILNNF